MPQFKCAKNNFTDCIGTIKCPSFIQDHLVHTRPSCFYETLCKNKREQELEDAAVEAFYAKKDIFR